jgi:hypothetical protein
MHWQEQCQPPAGSYRFKQLWLQGNNTACSSGRVPIKSSGNNNKQTIITINKHIVSGQESLGQS